MRQSPCTSTITGVRLPAIRLPARAAAPTIGSEAMIASGANVLISPRTRSGSRR